MDARKNPFVPGAGTAPPELAGRDDILALADTCLGRLKVGKAHKSLMLVGLRGVGKTVLLNRIAEMADDYGQKRIMFESRESRSLEQMLLPHLRQLVLSLDWKKNLNQKLVRGLRVIKSFASVVRIKYGDIQIGLDIEPEKGTADSGELENDLPDLLCAVAEAAQSQDKQVLILIDETQYLEQRELVALIMSVHKVVQCGLPLVLVGGGLPQLVGLAGKARSYAERLFDVARLGPLDPVDSENALQTPVKRVGVSFSREALDEILSLTKGYPYFLQEWGYHTWNVATEPQIDLETVKRASVKVIGQLDSGFFRVRLDRLTPREKDYLRAMAELGVGPHRSGDIAAVLKVKVETIAPLRSGLIKKGMIYSPAHGDTAFTVPLFDEYMMRTIPAIVPKRKKAPTAVVSE